MVSIMGLIFLEERIEINSIWDRDLDLIEELEEKEKEIEFKLDWVKESKPISILKGFRATWFSRNLFFSRGCVFLPEIPPEA